MKKYYWDSEHEWDKLDKEIESIQASYDKCSDKLGNSKKEISMPEFLMWSGAVIGFWYLWGGIATIIPIGAALVRASLIGDPLDNIDKMGEWGSKLSDLKHERTLKQALVGKLGNGGLNDEEYRSRLSEIDDEVSALIRIKELKKEISFQTNNINKKELELELAKLTEETETKRLICDAMRNAKYSFQKELDNYPCPEHGTTPKIKLVGESISADEYCCNTQFQTVQDFLAKAAEDSHVH